MAAGDLTTLANVKGWLNVASTADDALLGRLITAASRFILNWISRGSTLDVHSVTERRDGTGGASLLLRQYPVLSVQSVTVDGQTVQQQTDAPFGGGWWFEAWDGDDTASMSKLTLAGTCFPQRHGNVSVSYTAGYRATDAASIPATAPYVLSTVRPWTSDQGVAHANGSALTAVAGTPSAGQYSVSNGLYTFAAADAGAAVLISYGYTPEDLAQACLELVGERYRNRDRIGQVSKSLGGQETMSYSQRDMHPLIAELIKPYANVCPV